MKSENEVSWTELLPTGEESVVGSIFDFLAAVVDRQPGKRLPPLPVLIDMLKRHSLGGGMGGGLRWHAVTIDAPTYESFRATIATSQIVSDCDATRFEEWRAWCAERDSAIPFSQHVALLDRLQAAEIRRDRGGDAEAMEYIATMNDYFSFLSKHASSA